MALKLIQGLYSFILVFATFVVSKYFTDMGLEDFYISINLPNETPDNDYFKIIWRGLYGLLFLSFYIILLSKKNIEEFEDANMLFIMQLFLQILWTFSFFVMGQILASFIVILGLDIVAFLMGLAFFRINKWALAIILPYYCWILFASYLNGWIVFLN